MIDNRELNQYRMAAEQVIKKDTELTERVGREMPLMKLAVEAVTDIRINYAKGVKDVIELMVSGEAPGRLARMVEDYKTQINPDTEEKDYYDKGVTTTPVVSRIDPTPHWWNEVYPEGSDSKPLARPVVFEDRTQILDSNVRERRNDAYFDTGE